MMLRRTSSKRDIEVPPIFSTLIMRGVRGGVGTFRDDAGQEVQGPGMILQPAAAATREGARSALPAPASRCPHPPLNDRTPAGGAGVQETAPGAGRGLRSRPWIKPPARGTRASR